MGGITYTLSCPHCGRIYEIDYGATVLYNPISLFVSSTENGGKPLLDFLVTSRKIREKAYSLANQGYALDFDYQHKFYYCSHCRKGFVRFYFRLYKDLPDGNRAEYEPEYICCHCHRPLAVIEEQDCHNIEISCRCGNNFSLDTDDDHEPLEWQ
ncbi:MAG: hypothetical protein K5819_06890 [Lachnospiraceae bacterium]|jgi:hypothetical protein|nr:hypothetical protein [Lachnospiraceae bacterium]